MAATLKILVILLSVLLSRSHADILVLDAAINKTVDSIPSFPALFGPDFPDEGLKGLVVLANPMNGCTEMAMPPKYPIDTPLEFRNWILLVHRHNCTYAEKVFNAQKAGYKGVIVMNIGSNQLEHMGANTSEASTVHIPSLFIGQLDGDTIEDYFKDYSRFYMVLNGDTPFSIQEYLLPFAVTIAVCFFGMLVCMIIKCVRDYRRSLRHRLSWRALRKLPIHKFQAGDPYEVCAVCLEDFVNGDKLRVLPCDHAYHSKCIDPWLTKRRRVCPVCKQKVQVGNEVVPDTDDDSDNERSVSEQAPLLQQATRVSAGTFAETRENPFQRARRQFNSRYSSSSPYANLNAEGGSEHSSPEPVHASAASVDDEGYYPVGESSSYTGNAALMPAQGEQLPDDELQVVTVTRSIKKKKKKKKAKRPEVPPSDGEHSATSSDVVVQIDPADDHHTST